MAHEEHDEKRDDADNDRATRGRVSGWQITHHGFFSDRKASCKAK
jgi:hypothetical protein